MNFPHPNRMSIPTPQWDELDAALTAFRANGDMAPARAITDRFQAGQAQALRKIGLPQITEDERQQHWEDSSVLRAMEVQFQNDLASASSQRLSEQMAEVARAGNELAERMVSWTKVLAGATVVLALATLALIWATISV